MSAQKGKAPTAATVEASDVKTLVQKESNMANSTEVQVSSQPPAQSFNFEGKEVRVVLRDGEPWFVAADLVKALNLTNSRVALKALSDDEKGVSSTYTPGGKQDVAVVSEGGMWTLILRCRDAVTEGTVPYRVRRWVTSEVLPAIRKTGVYVGKPFSINPGDVLTQEEQNTLRLMLKTAAERLPKNKQGALMTQGWSKLKAHFKVPYREIPRQEFSEAVSIIARHTAEWEVVDEAPSIERETVNQIVVRLADQASQGNSYPIETFMPLVNVILGRLGMTSFIPANQEKEIVDRLDRLGSLFHPMSDQFSDLLGIRRALRGLHPRIGVEEPSYRKLIHSPKVAA